MKSLRVCFLLAGTTLAAAPHWTETMRKTSVDARPGVRQELYEYIDDSSFQRVGELTVANVQRVTQTTFANGEWIESVSVTKMGFNCSQHRQGPLQPPLSSRVIRHNLDGTVADVTSAASAQSPAMKIGLTQTVGPDDRDFAYACSHKW
jgi:hypothetical protein